MFDSKTIQYAPYCPSTEGSKTAFFQPKLTVNELGDEYEQEADAVADKVMRMPNPLSTFRIGDLGFRTPEIRHPKSEMADPSIHFGFGIWDFGHPKSDIPNPKSKPIPLSQISRKCADCEEEDNVQRKESSGGGQAAPSLVNDVIASSGKPLDSHTQQFMESRMGHDFSQVQVHTDSQAAESATAVNALAYTSGNHIVFNSGQYAPDTEGGKRLLAHELVHVGQQGVFRKSSNRHSPIIQRTEKDTKQLCPTYWRYNSKAKVETYNCAGLSHRTYSVILADELGKLLKKGKQTDKCSKGAVKHWVWIYDYHLEDHKGNVTEKPITDFHTVAGVVDSNGNDPTDVYSKNGPRPVEGPGTGPSFKPKDKEQAKDNTSKGKLLYDKSKNPIYKIRKNMAEWIFCLPCPKS